MKRHPVWGSYAVLHIHDHTPPKNHADFTELSKSCMGKSSSSVDVCLQAFGRAKLPCGGLFFRVVGIQEKSFHSDLFLLEAHLEYKRPLPCKMAMLFLAEFKIQQDTVLDILKLYRQNIFLQPRIFFFLNLKIKEFKKVSNVIS